ncbi:MAG: 4-amino-4-deoxy-L-arabinose transferase [Peptostreptococcaceae bacterium]|nr:4-amino-4-deoxy-L-arabinose transferase [Peptostreptococcaceae bacterium]
MIKKNNNQEIMLAVYVICYFIVSLYTLTKFPFIHSDEAWLSGLTRNMMDTGNLGITETFYNLKPRFPHGIKILFHLLQMPFLVIFQYDVFSFRLLSLFFSCMSLIIFYILLKYIFCRDDEEGMRWYPLLGTVLLSIELQFIYASHFARQEIILVFCIIFAVYALISNKVVLAAVISGLAIGIHPNSFLIGTMCLAVLVPFENGKTFPQKRLKAWKPFALYTGITGAFAAVFLAISLFFDRGFIKHYLEYGNSEFAIGAPITDKLAEVPYFLQKLWYGVSGTYYVPDIKLELVLFALAFILAVILVALNQKTNRAEMIFVMKGLIGLVAGMIIIGRYNQTSIIFVFPLLFLLILLAADSGYNLLVPRRVWPRNITIIILTVCLAISSYINIKPWMDYSYYDYIGEISKTVAPNEKVLANLNCEYYFDNGKLLDYRNLSFLKENNMTIADYIEENDIEYIILSDELDFIYSQRPVWNIIYGNLRYMDDLNDYTKQKCVLVDSFRNNTYGVRIVQYMNSNRDFTVKIFKVKDFI